MSKGKKEVIKPATINPVSNNQELPNQALPNQQLNAVQQVQTLCENNLHRYVLARTHDGWCIDGIVEYVDNEYVCLAVPTGGEVWHDRAFVPFGRPRFYPYPYYPRQRFYRQVLPLAALGSLALLPFF